MLGWILNALFGCGHRRKSIPMTTVDKEQVGSSATFVVCLDCGKRFRYDWEHMRIGKAVPDTDRLTSSEKGRK